MSTCIKIRGIYATALTKLMLDSGYDIVDPSSKIRKLFGLDETVGDYEILIRTELISRECISPAPRKR